MWKSSTGKSLADSDLTIFKLALKRTLSSLVEFPDLVVTVIFGSVTPRVAQESRIEDVRYDPIRPVPPVIKIFLELNLEKSTRPINDSISIALINGIILTINVRSHFFTVI
jgi:hypothetical protein